MNPGNPCGFDPGTGMDRNDRPEIIRLEPFQPEVPASPAQLFGEGLDSAQARLPITEVDPPFPDSGISSRGPNHLEPLGAVL